MKKSIGWEKIFLGTAMILLVVTILLTQQPSVWGGRLAKWLASVSPPTISNQLKEVTKTQIVDEESAVISVVDKASPAVVSIVLKRVGFDPFSGPYAEESGIGTGFIIDPDGMVLTNRHVVADTRGEYTVVTKDKKTYPVKEINRDTVNDLAILKIDAKGLPFLILGESGRLKVGQTVVAIGNALGRFSNTVTKGVVSGLGRGLMAQQGFGQGAEQLEDVIQTDAALNPGNSGGPLLDLSAQVVGINVAISQGAQNIGFSIPIDLIKPVIEEFKQHGRIIRPYLGVEYVIISSEMATIRRLPEGAFIQGVVPNSPAEKANLKAYDIITEFGGEKVNETNALAKLIGAHQVGDSVTMVINRSGEKLTLKVVLEERKD
ncbi:MAG: trypsin-like peptidase domain-containing protein [bacterium]|nr:trypsin-like peptidase domain-containing protein [bacterium]